MDNEFFLTTAVFSSHKAQTETDPGNFGEKFLNGINSSFYVSLTGL